MVITTKISENIHNRKWEGNQNGALQKSQLNTKEGSHGGIEGHKRYDIQKTNSKVTKVKSFLISNYIKYKLIKPSIKRQRLEE